MLITSAPVTIKDLTNELHDVISWFQLGIYLNISPSELMKIRADHREKTDDCKTEMLVTWLRQTTDASWSAVVRALVGIRMGALAQKVAVKYGEAVQYKLFAWSCTLVASQLKEDSVLPTFQVFQFSKPLPITSLL